MLGQLHPKMALMSVSCKIIIRRREKGKSKLNESRRLRGEMISGIIHFSAGFAMTDPEDSRSLEDYVQAADALMYAEKKKKKQGGSNRK